MFKKIIIYVISILVIIIITIAITNYVTQRRANKIYAELKDGYSNLEESNRQLREINGKLEINNSRLANEINAINEDIRRTTIIIGEFEESIKGARNTIERIEITIGFIEKIIRHIPNETILLEESDLD